MRQGLLCFFSALVVLSFFGGASAETTNAIKDNPRETNQSVAEPREGEVGTGIGEPRSIKSQGATKRNATGINQGREVTQEESIGTNQNETVTQQEPVGLVDQLKQGAKGEVNRRGNEINEKIERFGQE